MADTITQIGRYEISRQLVDTALASVYDAFDPVERKPVAIRVPQDHASRRLDAYARAQASRIDDRLELRTESGRELRGARTVPGNTPLDSHLEASRKMDPPKR